VLLQKHIHRTGNAYYRELVIYFHSDGSHFAKEMIFMSLLFCFCTMVIDDKLYMEEVFKRKGTKFLTLQDGISFTPTREEWDVF
jgi:hypothetical protein